MIEIVDYEFIESDSENIDDFNNKLESQDKRDRAFLDQHLPQTLQLLAKADALINKIDRDK